MRDMYRIRDHRVFSVASPEAGHDSSARPSRYFKPDTGCRINANEVVASRFCTPNGSRDREMTEAREYAVWHEGVHSTSEGALNRRHLHGYG